MVRRPKNGTVRGGLWGQPGSVPPAVRPHRLAQRAAWRPGRAAGGPDGQPLRQGPRELDRVLAGLQTVKPLLRQVADHEICTTMPPDEVVTAILRLAEAW